MRIQSNRLAAALLLAGLAGAATPAAAEQEPFGRLGIDQVEALLGRKDVLIVDVNSAEVYAKGHVPGAVWSALQDVEKKLPADRSVRIVYYCHGVT